MPGWKKNRGYRMKLKRGESYVEPSAADEREVYEKISRIRLTLTSLPSLLPHSPICDLRVTSLKSRLERIRSARAAKKVKTASEPTS